VGAEINALGHRLFLRLRNRRGDQGCRNKD
jgi:hypothetical protein